MIKAILWDFGGVLTTSPFEAFNRYEEAHNLPKDFIRGVNTVNPTTNAWSKLENGLISIDAFDQEFEAESRAAGHVVGQPVMRSRERTSSDCCPGLSAPGWSAP
jgi:putative hydrolase of the HAD superfamily